MYHLRSVAQQGVSRVGSAHTSCGKRHNKGRVQAMLNERLKAALDSASALPPEVQDKVAAQIESALRNAPGTRSSMIHNTMT